MDKRRGANGDYGISASALPPVLNLTNAGVKTTDGYKDGVRRIPYPEDEYKLNNENLTKAIQQYLGGIDNAAVNVWWDKKGKKVNS